MRITTTGLKINSFQAMSVVVKEKTALQQQLRQKNELVVDRNKQIHSLTVCNFMSFKLLLA